MWENKKETKELNIDKTVEKLNTIVDKFTVGEELTTTTVAMRIGNKVYNLVPSSDIEIISEDMIRKEIEDKLVTKRDNIKKAIATEMNIASTTISALKSEFERKEKLLQDTIKKSAPMPDVTIDHARKGLSLVKGYSRGELHWLVRRKYNPKFIDHKPIEPLYIKKLLTNIYIIIKTNDNNVTQISTHYINSLDLFEHYHQRRPDCWGNWQYPTKWSTADDILKIADDATAVLENINSMSLANRSPNLLPKFDTLRRHVLDPSTVPTTPRPRVTTTSSNLSDLREGLNSNIEVIEDTWGN